VRILRILGAPVGAADSLAPVVLIDRATPTGAAEVARRQAQGQMVCLLDDPGAGRLSADLVVDPPTGAIWPPAGGRRLTGFEHVLLRRDIRAARTVKPARTDVLLSMGGSDPEGLTPALARALRAAGAPVRSVLGGAYRGLRPPGEVLDQHDWPHALAHAGLLVSRFGHTLLEAAHLGTPALAVVGGERVAAQARAFAAHGTAEAIAIDGPGDAGCVAARVLGLCKDPALLAAMAVRGHELVDGLGATRVATAIRELAQSATGVAR
jgi:UDP-2,4-diacetamido-2,4,6-trideoxy-beta-L-altropyranose hydrolase